MAECYQATVVKKAIKGQSIHRILVQKAHCLVNSRLRVAGLPEQIPNSCCGTLMSVPQPVIPLTNSRAIPGTPARAVSTATILTNVHAHETKHIEGHLKEDIRIDTLRP